MWISACAGMTEVGVGGVTPLYSPLGIKGEGIL